MDLSDLQVERNLKGCNLEKRGHLDRAILLFEANIVEGCTISLPYERLIRIYGKLNMRDQQIRVLKIAIGVFEKLDRADAPFKLFKFKSKLEKITMEMSKTGISAK